MHCSYSCPLCASNAPLLQAAYAKLEEMKSNSATEVESQQQQSTAQLTAMSRCETQSAGSARVADELFQGARAVQERL